MTLFSGSVSLKVIGYRRKREPVQGRKKKPTTRPLNHQPAVNTSEAKLKEWFTVVTAKSDSDLILCLQ